MAAKKRPKRTRRPSTGAKPKPLRPGQVLEEFDLGGSRVVFRTPMEGDAPALMRHINRLVDERAPILVQKRLTLAVERKWLAGILRRMPKGEAAYVVVEMDGEVIGSANVDRGGRDANRHTATLGIGLSRERGRGIGTRLMRLLLRLARDQLGARLVHLSVFGHNRRAIRCYEKAGFTVHGRIPRFYRHHGRFRDKVIMARSLRPRRP